MTVRSKATIIVSTTLAMGLGVGLLIGYLAGREEAPPSDIIRAGFIDEFLTRQDGYPGLRREYGLDFPIRPHLYDNQDIYQALQDGQVEVISGNATAGIMLENDLVTLRDDRNHFPPYEAAPVVRVASLAKFEGLEETLQSLAGKISLKRMMELNHRVKEEGGDPRLVARAFVFETGLLAEGNPSAPARKGEILIGHKHFSEQEILAEILAHLIREKTGYSVRLGLRGGTATCFNALRTGKIDLYPEYTGTGLELMGARSVDLVQNRDEAFDQVSSFSERDYDVRWMGRFGFNNTWALIMRRAQAEKYGIESISDLARVLEVQGRALEAGHISVPKPPRASPIHELPLDEQIRLAQSKFQPAVERGKRTPEDEAEIEAKQDLLQWKSQADALENAPADALSPDQQELNASWLRVLRSRLTAESRRLRVAEQDLVLKNHRTVIAERADDISPIQELHDAYRLVALTEEALYWSHRLCDSWDAVYKEYERHETLVGAKHLAATEARDRRLLTEELDRLREQKLIVANHSYRESEHRERRTDEDRAARDLMEVASQRLSASPPAVSPAVPAVPLSLPSNVSLIDLRREAERIGGEAERAEKEADFYRKEADNARHLVILKRREGENTEWDLRFQTDELARLKQLPEGERLPEIVAACEDRIEALGKTLRGIRRESLPQLARWARAADLRSREKRIEAQSVRREAVKVSARLEEAESSQFMKTLTSFIIAGCILGITVGVAFVVGRFVKNKEELTLKGVTDPEQRKKIHTPYFLIRRIAVPVIGLTGVVLMLLQFETFREMGITVLASAGVLSLVAGFAARGLLSNAISGLTLCFSQPIRIGDRVRIGDEHGEIEDIGLLYTTFRTREHRRVLIPNQVLAGKEVDNHSIRDSKVATKLMIHLDHDADVEKAREIIVDVAKASPHWNQRDEPEVWFREIGESSLVLQISVCGATAEDTWQLGSDVLANVHRRFAEEGIPFPKNRLTWEENGSGNGGHARPKRPKSSKNR